MLSKTGYMTINLFKNKAKKELLEENGDNGDMGHNFHKNKTKDRFKIKANKEVS